MYSGLTQSYSHKFRGRRRRRRQGLLEAKSKQEAKVPGYNSDEYEWNAQKYYTKTVEVLFIVIPWFKLKRTIQREPTGLFKKCFVSLESSKMSVFDLLRPWGLQWWIMKLIQCPLSRASQCRAAEKWQGWGRKMLSTTFFRWYIFWASFLRGHALRWLLPFFRVQSDSTSCWNQFRLGWIFPSAKAAHVASELVGICHSSTTFGSLGKRFLV